MSLFLKELNSSSLSKELKVLWDVEVCSIPFYFAKSWKFFLSSAVSSLFDQEETIFDDVKSRLSLESCLVIARLDCISHLPVCAVCFKIGLKLLKSLQWSPYAGPQWVVKSNIGIKREEIWTNTSSWSVKLIPGGYKRLAHDVSIFAISDI